MIEKDRLVRNLTTLSSSLPISIFKKKKEAFYEKPLILADREMVETQSDEILYNADTEDVSLLVVGDPFGCDNRPSDPFLFYVTPHKKKKKILFLI